MLTSIDFILVCVLPGLRDLESARLSEWHRIPLRAAPKIICVDALAFYHPGTYRVKDNGNEDSD